MSFNNKFYQYPHGTTYLSYKKIPSAGLTTYRKTYTLGRSSNQVKGDAQAAAIGTLTAIAPENTPQKLNVCGLQADGKQFDPKCLTGCHNLRWQDGPNARATDRQQLRRAFGNYVITDSAKLPFMTPVNRWAPQLSYGSVPQARGEEEAWQAKQLGSLTPFRQAMNAGDPFSKQNALPDSTIISNTPSNQVQGSRRAANQAAATTAGSGLTTVVGGSAYTGNPKRVYDSSDYVRFKKLQAKNRNYNDPTFGGDDNFAAQTAIARVRH